MQYFEFIAARGDTGAVLPLAVVTVKLTGTATLAALYDRAGAELPNPMTATNAGLVGIAAPNGNYDIAITSSDGAYALPLVRNVQFYDLSELDAKVSHVDAAICSAISSTAMPRTASMLITSSSRPARRRRG